MQINISFIVPIYKVEEEYLNICLNSLLKLRRTDVEFILVDDGSPDNCGNICDEYAKNDERIVVVHKQNEGVSKARNSGIDCAHGKYITFIDADDWIEPVAMENIIEQVLKEKCDIIAYGQFLDFRNVKSIQVRPFNENTILNGPNEMIELQKMIFVRGYRTMKSSMGSGVMCNAVDKFIKRDIMIDLKFDPSIKIGEDSLFYLKLFNKCERIMYIDICAYHYRMRKTSANHITKKMGYQDIVLFAKEAEKILNEQKSDKALYEALYCRCYDLMLEQFNRSYSNVNATIIVKLRNYLRDISSYPLNEAIKTVHLCDQSFKGKIRLLLFKLHLGWVFLIVKEGKKKFGLEKYEKSYY